MDPHYTADHLRRYTRDVLRLLAQRVLSGPGYATEVEACEACDVPHDIRPLIVCAVMSGFCDLDEWAEATAGPV